MFLPPVPLPCLGSCSFCEPVVIPLATCQYSIKEMYISFIYFCLLKNEIQYEYMTKSDWLRPPIAVIFNFMQLMVSSWKKRLSFCSCLMLSCIKITPRVFSLFKNEIYIQQIFIFITSCLTESGAGSRSFLKRSLSVSMHFYGGPEGVIHQKCLKSGVIVGVMLPLNPLPGSAPEEKDTNDACKNGIYLISL